jgi:MtrB/PioB family decaheme-associated outer membrane protein
MNVRGDILKARRTALLCCCVFWGGGPAAIAADAPAAAVPAETGWYSNGGVEVGGRFFIERPPSGFGRAPPPANWLTPSTSDSIAKFEEYGEIPRGLYWDWFRLQAGSNDGQYLTNFSGRHIGLNDQEYEADFYKVGEHYLTVGWNQIPHLISTSAKTVFFGVGSPFLAVSDPLQANLQPNLANATANSPAGVTARSNIENFINNAANPATLSTQRDTAYVNYKATPSDDFEVKVDYSHERRTGTRPIGVNYGYAAAPSTPGFASNVIEAIQPFNDTTQNVRANAQYVSTTPWGKRWTAQVQYFGSHYDNALSMLEAENPFCLTCTLVAPLGPDRAPTLLRLALPPSNNANAITLNSFVDLPWNGRYTSTIQYNVMQQNDPFVSTATNGLMAAPFPAPSANARMDALLLNNVLTTNITKDLKTTLRYRYYDLDNRTPELLWQNYVASDSSIANDPRRNLALAYNKQDANAEVNYRATNTLTVGAIAGWQRYDRTRRDVNVTNEYFGKFYGDMKLWDVGLARGNLMYASRRYDRYDAFAFVAVPGLQFSENVVELRKYDIANRDRLKGELFFDIPVNSIATVTPNLGFRIDDYPPDVLNQLGVSEDRGWNAGIEAGFIFNPQLKASIVYNYEPRELTVSGCCGGAPGGVIPENIWTSNITQHYNTFIVALDWKAIPKRLEFKAEYLYVSGSEANDTQPCASGNNGCTGSGTGVTTTQFPTERNELQRFSVLGKYFVDEAVVRQLGFQGEVVAKLRYVFERNRNSNWATDNMTPYVPTADQTADLTGGGRSLFLAAINPNYTAQFIAASLAFTW